MRRKIQFPNLRFLIPVIAAALLTISIAPHRAIASSSALRNSGDGTLRRIRVPILMYHYVSLLPEDADATRIGLTVAPEMFTAHMQYLEDQGYHTISLYDLNDALLNGTPLPSKPIILTFDDGYIDHYVTVFPILQQHHFTGTFFIITGHADNNDPGYMSWDQIQEMSEAGMSMEAHTKRHLDLRGRDADFLVYEIDGSIESLDAHTDHEIHMFAYPSGRYDDTTLSVIATMPVWRAVGTEHGDLYTTDNYFELPRLRVSNDTGVNGLAYLIHSAP